MLKTGLIMGFIALFGKFLGFFRTIIIARYFGVSGELDNWFLIFAIFSQIAVFFELSTLGAVFLPNYMELKENQAHFFYHFRMKMLKFSIVFWLLFVLFGILIISIGNAFTIIELVESPYLMIVLIMGINIPFIGLATIYIRVKHANNYFIKAALSEISINVVGIFSIVYFADNIGIISIAIGLTGGHLIRTLINFTRYNKKLEPVEKEELDIFSSKIIRDIRPIILLSWFISLFENIPGYIFSYFEEGFFSAYYLAQRLRIFPYAIVILILSQLLFPKLTKTFQSGNHPEFANILKYGISFSLILTIPISIIVAHYSFPIVNFIYRGGAFDLDAAYQTSFFLSYDILVLPIFSLIELLLVSLYAQNHGNKAIIPLISGTLVFIIGGLIGYSLENISIAIIFLIIGALAYLILISLNFKDIINRNYLLHTIIVSILAIFIIFMGTIFISSILAPVSSLFILIFHLTIQFIIAILLFHLLGSILRYPINIKLNSFILQKLYK